MMKLSEAIKGIFYFIVFILVIFSQVYADVCDDALLEFRVNTSELMSRPMVAYDDIKTYSATYSQFKSQIAGEGCAQAVIDQTGEDRQTLKDKRIATIENYLRLGIKEENGVDITFEYDYLTGQKKKYSYEFDDIFNNGGEKILKDGKSGNEIYVPPKKSSVIVRPVTTSGQCSDVILENEAVNTDNVRNQDSVGWCYAYVAADMLSYKLKKKISAVSLYDSGQDIENDISDKKSAKGGDVASSIEDYISKKGGLCLEEDLPSTDFKFCTDRRYYDFLNYLLGVVRDKRLDQESNNSQCFEHDLQSAFPGVDIGMIKNHMNKYGTRKLIEALYDRQCKKISFQGIKVNLATMLSSRTPTDTLINTLDEQISKGEVAGIGYDYNTLNGTEKDGTSHASLVVGRRSNPKTGACEYLVRNSWGKDCDLNEGNGLSCHKNCSSGSCRYSGNFWVSTERLKGSILGVTYFK